MVTVELLVNKPLLNIVLNETNKDVRMYIEEFYSSRYLDTLLYMDEVSMELDMHRKCSSLYTNATIEEKG